MLDRAKELAEWLLPAFTTSSGFPIAFYKLGEYVCRRLFQFLVLSLAFLALQKSRRLKSTTISGMRLAFFVRSNVWLTQPQ